MKEPIFVLFLLVVFVGQGYSQKAPEGTSAATDIQEISALLTRLADAKKNGDIKTLNEIYSDQLVITASDDSMRGKKEETGHVRPNDPSNPTAVQFEDVRIRTFGNAAAAVGVEKVRFKLFHATAGEQIINVGFRFTALFAKEAGVWRLAVLHLGKGK